MHLPIVPMVAAAATPAPGGGGTITAPPDPSGLPGSGQILALLSGLRWFCLVAAVATICVGAAIWWAGSHSNNPYHSTKGKLAVVLGAAGALVTGAAPAVVAWFSNLGSQVPG